MYRDLTMKEISEQQIGQTLQVAGWVENIRDHGGVSFIDLRDMYGVLQVVIRKPELLKGITKEMCLSITGLMEHRDEETYNPKIPSGTIELEAHKIDVLGRVYKQLPFEIQTSKEIREDVRLKYRYLDLRNAKVKDNIVFRSKVISYLRQKMTDMGFLEIQTPILCASSPEGARDYIVPSRKFKGKFYALPQAPQQYKQLLMASGFDKYFQIAPCFRDEDARADRSPGEFYQLDFEMSFVTQEDVFKVGEEVLHDTFVKFAPEGSRITETPFPIISYKQAMLEFGCDKPDLRNPLRIMDVTEFFQRCTFKPFIGRTVRAIKVHAEMSKGFHEKLLSFATSLGMGGLGYLEVAEDMSYKGPIDKFIPEEMKGELAEMAGLSAGDTIFFIADKEDKANYYAGHIRTELGEKLDLIEKDAYRFCYVNDFPMFELDPETKQIGFTHNPFSMPQGGLEALNTMDPLEILAYQYDIVCNGVELSSGAVRNHDIEIMKKAFAIAGYDEETLKTKFGALYQAFQFGAPPHAGMAPGVDRMIMLLRNEDNIREVIAFPMNGNAQDLMCGAPGEVTEQQLREVHIKVRD
ncbi:MULTISPECIES: aspartate--tRNA ligase [Waltera]|jgi:aspartyl-tRNA synthetase|uniref:Aspartate--tRNA(Asp/Asn) ligase n=1 Tax=Waltera intestinalis TaxID=2606635 RepID=A0A6L5YJJ8_9FIRM|nr:aspartate--tRNA ligase [Waltera intestinalis]MBO5162767.1 aspartate--tRNA ligase [Lachnospiraceae bacterium]MBP9666983.1 aspartate--tRNA ligase [Acetatifactor sp.]RHP94967.1 aspartate--tRNA ligase [Firmicutes bacterium AM59-13]RHQ76048.1 aspartate--tRNA ligase [Firmicutes bacterium AF22-6AC]RHU89984.1 aspartate--tRNA ligase [Firmicutes bacterium OM08-11AC]CDB01460.1 aspartate--tRNA ligase [Firmicutes bacterium CAG:65]SCG90808.1 Aspartate--tRNA ligase [uncultured Clostridium sp.]